MSRTYRRRGERHEYLRSFLIDRYSPEGLRTIARFHSDSGHHRSGVPHWFRRIFKRRQRTYSERELRRWLADPGYDPVTDVRHRNSAKWAWW